MISQLESLKQYTTIVADTGDFKSIQSLYPTDVTTNPSLILKAIQQETYQSLFKEVIYNNQNLDYQNIADHLLVTFGKKILEIVPGRVSTEIDARLSFDTKKTIERARYLISLYEKIGIPRDRILIKIASTWEGIKAASILEMEEIRCNLTLLFSLFQALTCAQANVTLISPFVGRIYDWNKKIMGDSWSEELNIGLKDPGVKVVSNIYNYYKSLDIKTKIMGASFRNIEQILALAGCDLLTISPQFLFQLSQTPGYIEPKINSHSSNINADEVISIYDENKFRNQLNYDLMTNEKLSEGIRLFTDDLIKLESMILYHKS
ncbi:MAG: transaldolase [Bordetella sp.]|nr:MAG: transaldolase [Bordetella sp.]